jgi:hypothetical protein
MFKSVVKMRNAILLLGEFESLDGGQYTKT